MNDKPQPSVVQFASEDLDDDMIDESVERSSTERKKKSGSPVILIAGGVFFVFALLFAGYYSYLLVKKKGQQTIEPIAVDQPQIIDTLTPAPMPIASTAVINTPSVSSDTASPLIPTTTPVVNPANEVKVAPVISTDLDKVQLENQAKDLQSIKTSLTEMASRFAALEAELKTIKTSQTVVTNSPSVVKPQAKPVPKPVQQSNLSNQDQKKDAVEPQVIKDYYISGIVNNRVFIVKRNADGSESEQSIVVGDRLDNGKKVIGIDAKDKSVSLEGSSKITTRSK